VSRRAALLENSIIAAVLLVCAVCSLCIAAGTAELEQANARRRTQLQLLDRLVADPLRHPAGPIAALDGLFGRRVARVVTAFGPAITFVDAEPVVEADR